MSSTENEHFTLGFCSGDELGSDEEGSAEEDHKDKEDTEVSAKAISLAYCEKDASKTHLHSWLFT